jgi:hypothetical protein
MPTTVPLLIRITPPGKLPLIVSAAVPVVSELIMAVLVARTGSEPFHPAAKAKDRKFCGLL